MDKKERERAFLAEIKTLNPDLIPGEIVDSESPDFICNQDFGKLGIEIVEYVRGQNAGESALRRIEVIRQRIIDEAKNEFYKTKDIPLWIIFSWYPRKLPRKSEVSELASIAVWAIGNNTPQNLFDNIEITNEYLEDTLLKKFVHKIRVIRVRNEKQALWGSIESGFISVVPNEIQEIISSKNVKVRQYKTNCDEVWLVIVAEGTHISSTVGLEQDTLTNQFDSEFDKVLFYDRQEHKVINLVG